MSECFIPKTLKEALEFINKTKVLPIAGGTDVYVANKRDAGVTPVFPCDVMLISNLKELKGISLNEKGECRIGALSTSAEIAGCELVPWHVRQAAGQMGAISLRNLATIGGNIANASPKGDLPAPLMLCNARVELSSVNGKREIPVDDFIIEAKKTKREPNELITAIICPKPEFTYSFFHKIGSRRANTISKLTLSAAMTVKDGVVVDFRAASGGCGKKSLRNPEAENLLCGCRLPLSDEKIQEFLNAYVSKLSPRAMPEFRLTATRRMLENFIRKCMTNPKSGVIEEN